MKKNAIAYHQHSWRIRKINRPSSQRLTPALKSFTSELACDLRCLFGGADLSQFPDRDLNKMPSASRSEYLRRVITRLYAGACGQELRLRSRPHCRTT